MYAICGFLLFLSDRVSGQDKLLTQAFAHPVDLNPAFAGSIDGRYRVSLAYRDQWRSIIESPFTTMAIYGDFRIIPDDRKDDFFGAGFSLMTDRTALLNFNQNILSLYGSFHKALNADRGQFISAGLNVGIAQRNINYEHIVFNDQFNGLDAYSNSTAEILPANNFAYFDIGLGIKYVSSLSEFSSYSVGVSMDHIPGNSISFYHNAADNEDVDLPDAKLERKLSAFASFELASGELFSLLPRILWQKQGAHQMLALAMLGKIDITNYDNQAVHFGGGIRINQTLEGMKPSAAYALFAYEVKGLLIGLSHDISLTQLSLDHPGKGAFELSISYTGFYENDDSLCPTF